MRPNDRPNAERRRILAEEMEAFRASYYEEVTKPGKFVSARMLNVTGLMLRELLQAGLVETNDIGYRPKGGR